MNPKNYLLINRDSNIVENIIVWDGDETKWIPPQEHIALVQEDINAIVWEFNDVAKDYELVEIQGRGAIGFLWNGSVLTTQEPKPEVVQEVAPTYSGEIPTTVFEKE